MEKHRVESRQRDKESQAIAASFDAWPAPEVRNNKIHMAYEQGAQYAERLPGGEYVEGSGFHWTWNDENDMKRVGTELDIDW